MTESSETTPALSDNEKLIFRSIDDSDSNQLQTLLMDKQNINIFDENNMTPLQHACYRGNKDIVQLLLDQGADVNLCQHEHNYTALHFAGLSGNKEVCSILLLAGANSSVINSVGRTPAQMAAFVGHHNCVAVINNFIPKADVECYSKPSSQDGEAKPPLPPFILESFYKFIMNLTIHPIRIALNLQKLLGLMDHLKEVSEVLNLMSIKEMNRGNNTNEVLSFKFYYLSAIVAEVAEVQATLRQNDNPKYDTVEALSRKYLQVNKDGNFYIMDTYLRNVIRKFTFHECTIFRQMVATLTGNDPPPALNVISSIINGQRGFIDTTSKCSTCGEEDTNKKCSKCKSVNYCDRECQRLHWHVHKKACKKVIALATNEDKSDSNTVNQDMQNYFAN